MTHVDSLLGAQLDPTVKGQSNQWMNNTVTNYFLVHKKVVCQNIVDDIHSLSETKKRGQTFVLKFEDIISDKKRVVRELFRYCGPRSSHDD